MNATEALETQDLVRRLAEAEATIEALLSGQIDAVVDTKSHTPVLLAKAQDALRDERDRAQRYLDTPDVILLALDMNGRITLVNRCARSLLGWTADELLGYDWIETCLPVRTRDESRKRFQNLLCGELSIAENLILTKSGEERLIEWRNTLLRDDDGRVIGTFSSGADITERHQATEALRTAEERMRFALQSADVGIWDMDPATGVVRWSEILESQYGLQPGTFGGTFEAFVERIHPDDRASVLETVRTAMVSGADFSFQNRTIWPDGTVRWLNGAGRFHLDEHGTAVRGLGISRDFTERHALEEQYHQAQKMDAVGRLAGGVAHDFNNLLTAILGYCELLLEDLDPHDPRQRDITEIQKAGTIAAGLTRQLLAFSRKEVVEPARLDLNVVVANMRAMLGRLIREDVKVVLGLRPELALVMADRGQVEQIVLNLAVNARDAMPTGGTLTIETANIELDEHYCGTQPGSRPGPYVALTVTDTGPGMTPSSGAPLRAVLHHQGSRQGHGPRPRDGPRHRHAERRERERLLQRIGKDTSFSVCFPPGERRGNEWSYTAHRLLDRTRATPRRPCSWWMMPQAALAPTKATARANGATPSSSPPTRSKRLAAVRRAPVHRRAADRTW